MALPTTAACDAVIPQFTTPVRTAIRYLAGNSEGLKDFSNICRQYVEACLSPQSLAFEPTFSDTDRRATMARVVLLVTTDGRPFCHGFKLGGFVATAAHCVRDMSEGEDIAVRSIASPETSRYKLAIRGKEIGPSFGNEDFALLRAQNPCAITTDEDRAWLGSPVMNQRVLIPQVNSYRLISTGFQTAPDLSGLVSFEDNPLCKASGVFAGGFILNGCQSAEGTSGTPYIQKDIFGHLRLVGIHSGETSGLDDPSLAGCATAFPNYGVEVPYELFARAMAGGKSGR
jgi:hypothetical protein